MNGKFKPRNPEKYAGNPENIVYRSSWELRFMSHLDKNPSVIQWASEELVIPYFDPTTNRLRRYFPDFVVKTKTKEGIVQTTVFEIKPRNETIEPKKPTNPKRMRRFITEVATWGKNQAKWKAATEFCADRGWKFQILTEAELFGK